MKDRDKIDIIQKALGAILKPPSKEDEERYREAQELCYSAWDSDIDDTVALAYKAINKSDYCSDAYNIFALYLPENLGEELLLYRWATRLAEVYWGEEFFKREKGYFYGLVHTRPYMRSRIGVARTLIALGCHEEAIQHLEALIELDSGDHVGARLLLSVEYLMLGRYSAFNLLTENYEDCNGCYGRYGKVFFLDAVGAPDEEYLQALKAALRQNQHVPQLLAHPETEVNRSGYGVSWSGPDGADEYLNFARLLWTSRPDIKRRLIVESKKILATEG
ncbi:MAG: hypothetical protein WCO10_00200 [bacterium]